MKQNDFYEVNGYTWFIPVDFIKENKCTKELEVVATESGRITFVPTIYKFRKPHEPQKPVIPEFVADWIDKHKNGKKKYRLSHALEHVFDDTELGLYIKQQEGDYTETIAKAWLDGYTVEKEKLYIVEIPNPNSAGGKLVLFKQQSSGRLILDMLNPNINKPKYLHLTEAEIKKDFEWAWRWAKEAEE